MIATLYRALGLPNPPVSPTNMHSKKPEKVVGYVCCFSGKWVQSTTFAALNNLMHAHGLALGMCILQLFRE